MLKFTAAAVFAIIGMVIIGYGLYKHPDDKINYLIGAISIIIAIILGIPDGSVGSPPTTPHPSSTSAVALSPNPEISPIPSPVVPAGNPITIYGIAYKDEQDNKQYYSIDRKIGIISSTYYGRKDENGEYKDGYYSKSNSNNATGYRLGFYYADDQIYYAEALMGNKIKVKMYFWGGEMIACTDLRIGDKSLYYTGTSEFEDVYEEFSDVYEIGMNT